MLYVYRFRIRRYDENKKERMFSVEFLQYL